MPGGGEVRLVSGNGWRKRRGFEKKGFYLTRLLYDSVASHHPTSVVKIAQIFSFYLVDLFIDFGYLKVHLLRGPAQLQASDSRRSKIKSA